MNPDEILEAARKAIAAGESADDVAHWIEKATGMSLQKMMKQHDAELRVAQSGNPVTDFLHQAAEGVFGLGDVAAGVGAAIVPGGKGYTEARDDFQQRTDDLNLLAPQASFVASLAPSTAMGGVLAKRGLQSAVSAIQMARGAAMVPSAAGLVGESGGAAMVPNMARISALQALRNMASPVVGNAASAVGKAAWKALPWGLGGYLARDAFRR